MEGDTWQFQDVHGTIRWSGPRSAGSHKMVFDLFLPKALPKYDAHPALCICADCFSVWDEGVVLLGPCKYDSVRRPKNIGWGVTDGTITLPSTSAISSISGGIARG